MYGPQGTNIGEIETKGFYQKVLIKYHLKVN